MRIRNLTLISLLIAVAACGESPVASSDRATAAQTRMDETCTTTSGTTTCAVPGGGLLGSGH